MRLTSFLIACIVFSSVSLAADEKIPWPEHPRPDFQRSAWINLNGPWGFAFDPKDAGEKEHWFEPGQHEFDRKIVVPFPWESKLSGITDTQYKGVAWYARDVEIPADKDWDGKDPWLIVGACDFEAKVWVNGQEAGSHMGGYLPFEINFAPYAKPGEKARIVIRAVDRTDSQQPTGKQVGWYTRTSGIWQTVYLESRHKSHIVSWQSTPDIGKGTVTCEVTLSPDDRKRYVSIMSPDGKFLPVSTWCPNDQPTCTVSVEIRDAKLWSPDSPTLYPITLNVTDGEGVLDSVQSYVALRQISIAQAPGRDYQYIHLNGKPIYLAGALHQSFHPDGIYQYPEDAVMRSDYELCKKIGINMLRIHIKVPIPRELYWADKLGVLIMQDMPCFWKYTKQAQDWYEQMLRGTIARDFNHPSIFAWVDFNETWGIEDGGYTSEHHKWVEQMYHLTKELDPTRLVEDNSPCKYDHTITDINSWHFYINDYEGAKKHIAEVVEKTRPGSIFNCAKGYTQANAPLINSEYGGISAGLGDQDISWCFKYLTNELRKHDRICGYIYTELSDIEWEHNGFVNYDRSPKGYGYDYWHPGMTLKDINSPDFIVIDAPTMIELKPGESREVPIKISHWSHYEAKQLQLRWKAQSLSESAAEDFSQVMFGYGLSRREPESRWNSRPARWKPFEVVDQEPIRLEPPKPAGVVGALCVELIDGDQILARNYVNVSTADNMPAVYTTGTGGLVLSFSPGDFAECAFTIRAPVANGQALNWVAGAGTGYYQYDLQVPERASLENVASISVSAELASRASGAKLDWPARRTPHDQPQTDAKMWPTDLTVSINGVPVEKRTLKDDPADARGALSHHSGLRGGYGFASGFKADGDVLRDIIRHAGRERLLHVRFEVPPEAEHKGGLTIYGRGAGLLGMPPMVRLTFKQGSELPAGFKVDRSPAVNRAVERIAVPIPTAEMGGHEWSLTVREPPTEWTSMQFDASDWRKARGGFGSRGTPNAIIGTRWDKPDIWLRTKMTIEDPSVFVSGTWRIYHDEDAQIYLNGQKVLDKPGFVEGYMDEPLSSDALKALRAGENVVAVHCHQTGGGQNIDVGLTLTRRPNSPK